MFTPKDKRKAIAEFLLTLGPTEDPRGSGSDLAPAAPAVIYEDNQATTKLVKTSSAKNPARKSNYLPKIVCYTDDPDNDSFVKGLLKTSPTKMGVEQVVSFNEKDLESRGSHMIDAVKHPGVIVVFSLQGLGAGSGRIISQWRKVCSCATQWGGKVLVKLPYDCKAWNDNTAFAQFCLDFDLVFVHRVDKEVAFATNCKVTRWSLHGGDWNLTEGDEEARRITWAEATWGDDSLLAEVESLLEDEESLLENKKCAPAKFCEEPGKTREGPSAESKKPLSMNINGSTAPAMPCEPVAPQIHRDKMSGPDFHLPLAVARKVKASEIEREPEARKAVDKEFTKLATMEHPDKKGIGVWDIDSVREKSDVRKEATALGVCVFFAMIAELCFQKGSELEKGDPGQVYKGRHVLLGDQVKDNNFEAAQFQDLGSSPPTMMASKVLDAWSLIVGYIMTQSDATSAYTQWFIGGGRGKGVPTWVSLPRHRWPKHWEGKYYNPVVLLVLALYGHPDAGGFWEERCDTIVKGCGWTKTCWKSLFYHAATKSVLIIYVDDFRMVAKPEYTPELWHGLRKVLILIRHRQRVSLGVTSTTSPPRFQICL